MEATNKEILERLIKLQQEMESIKETLIEIEYGDSDEELSDWAERELKKARSENEASYTSLEEL